MTTISLESLYLIDDTFEPLILMTAFLQKQTNTWASSLTTMCSCWLFFFVFCPSRCTRRRRPGLSLKMRRTSRLSPACAWPALTHVSSVSVPREPKRLLSRMWRRKSNSCSFGTFQNKVLKKMNLRLSWLRVLPDARYFPQVLDNHIIDDSTVLSTTKWLVSQHQCKCMRTGQECSKTPQFGRKTQMTTKVEFLIVSKKRTYIATLVWCQ